MRLMLASAPGVAALVVGARAGEAPAPAPVARAAEGGPAPGLRELYARVDGVVARLDAFRGPSDPPFGNGRRDAIGAAFVIDDRAPAPEQRVGGDRVGARPRDRGADRLRPSPTRCRLTPPSTRATPVGR